jgi:hypothetical protein
MAFERNLTLNIRAFYRSGSCLATLQLLKENNIRISASSQKNYMLQINSKKSVDEQTKNLEAGAIGPLVNCTTESEESKNIVIKNKC